MAKPTYLIAGVKSAFEAQDIDKNVYRKELVYPGSFTKKDPNTQEVEFNLPVNDQLMDHWVATFQRMQKNGVEVPLPVEHTTDPEKRRGTVVDLKKEWNPERNANALYAYVQFRDPQVAADMAKTSQVSLFSPPAFSDGKGNDYVRPITHVALTDYPLVPGLGKFDKVVAASLGMPRESLAILSMDQDPSVGDDTMSPMQQLAQDLGIDIGDETDDAAIAALIKAALDSEEEAEGEPEELNEDPADDANTDTEMGLDSLDSMDSEDPEDNGYLGVGSEELTDNGSEPAGGGSDTPIETFSDLAQALGIDTDGEADEQLIAQMIVDAWNADESAEGEGGDEEPVPDDAADPSMLFSPAAASFSNSKIIGMVARSRAAELENLCKNRKITPAQRDLFLKKYAQPKNVAFAMSHGVGDEPGDDYDTVIHALSIGAPAFKTGGRTGRQHAATNDGLLVKEAESRSKRNKR